MKEYQDHDTAIYRFKSQSTGKNEYLIISKSEAASIDVIDSIEPISEILKYEDTELKYILVTHAHHTRVNAVNRLKTDLGGQFCLHPFDLELLDSKIPKPDRFVKDKEIIKLGNQNIRIFHTPGHTKGSLSFWLNQPQIVFTGNTFVKGGHGRIWGPKSMSLIVYSLKRLNYNLSEEALIFPGDGELTSMKKEAWVNCLRSA